MKKDKKTVISAISTINWMSVKSGHLPIISEQAYSETFVEGFSDKVLVFCSDRNIRMARYNHKIEYWQVEGCSGQQDGFVLYWAVNLTQEIEKLKLREKLKEADREMDSQH